MGRNVALLSRLFLAESRLGGNGSNLADCGPLGLSRDEKEGDHKGHPLWRILNDEESEQALCLPEFTAVLMTYVLCFSPHIFSFFTHTSCSLQDLETNQRCEVTNTLLHLAYQLVCLFHRQPA